MYCHIEASRCRALWASVVQLCVEDFLAGRDVAFLGSRDFAILCDLAGLDVFAVKRRAADMAAAGVRTLKVVPDKVA